MPEGWDGVEADRHEERAKLERAKRIEREKQDDLAHASEKIGCNAKMHAENGVGASPPVAASPV